MNILAAVVCSSWRDQSLWPVFRDLVSSLERVSLCRRAVSPWRPRRPWTAQAEAWRTGTGNRLWPETRRRIWVAPTARPGKCQRTWKRGRQRRVLLLTRQSRRVPRVWRDPKQPETTVKTWPCAGTVPEPQTLWMCFTSVCVWIRCHWSVFFRILLAELESHQDAGPFLTPVNPKSVPGYRKIIKKPMDFSTIRDKLTNSQCVSLVN